MPALPPILEQWLKRELVSFLRAERADLRAVILTGSLAGKDATLLRRNDGQLQILSDVDVYAVVGDADRGILSASVPAPPMGAPLDLGVVGIDYFATMGATLPAVQIAGQHRILWQGDQPWSPPSSAQPMLVDPDDALLMLHNRIAEALAATTSTEGLYARWKLWQDAPLAWMAAVGEWIVDPPTRSAAYVQALTEGRLLGARDGLARWQRMQRQRQLPLDRSQLLALGALQPPTPVEWKAWVQAHWRATLCASLGVRTPASATNSELARRWLRRHRVVHRIRVARRYAPLGPAELSPWWRHGALGVAPEMIDLSLALDFLGEDPLCLGPELRALGVPSRLDERLRWRNVWRKDPTG